MKLTTKTALVGLIAVATASGAHSAMAQDAGNFARDKAVAVRERPHPEYDPRGLRVDGVSLDPVLRITTDYTDNVYGTDTGEVSDVALRIEPSIAATTNWSRHELSFRASAQVDRYKDLSDENSSSWQVGSSARIDILRNARVTGNAAISRFVEPRTASNTITASVVPIEYDQHSLSVTGFREFNRIRFTGSSSWNRLSYDNGLTAAGAIIDQSYRDRDALTLSGKVDYAFTPDTAFFVQLQTNWREFDRTAGLNRDSDGVQLLVGADFELSNLVRGQIGAGWIKQSYDGATLDDFSSLSVNGQLEWFATPLTTLTAQANRSIDDSGLVGSAGIVTDQLRLTADHELLRNLIVSGTAGYEHNRYLDFGRTDDRTSIGLSATYLMNRGVGLAAGLSRLSQDSSGANAGPDFDVTRVSLGVILRY